MSEALPSIIIQISAFLSASACLCGSVALYRDPEATVYDRLIMTAATIVALFVAAILIKPLSGPLTRMLDALARSIGKTLRSRIRRGLLGRADVGEDAFLAQFPDADKELAKQIRRAIADYFDVPAAKIRPEDDLIHDLGFDVLEPCPYRYVAERVLATHRIDEEPSITVCWSLQSLAVQLHPNGKERRGY